MRIATPFCGITWVWYNELQYQRWKYATPFRGDYVESGTINRPLRLRNERGKIYKQTTTCGLFIIQNVWQQTFHNIHFLRKYMAANTPKGVEDRFIAPVFQSKPIGFNVSK